MSNTNHNRYRVKEVMNEVGISMRSNQQWNYFNILIKQRLIKILKPEYTQLSFLYISEAPQV